MSSQKDFVSYLVRKTFVVHDHCGELIDSFLLVATCLVVPVLVVVVAFFDVTRSNKVQNHEKKID